MSSDRSLLLLGRDYPELGPLGVVSLPDGGALSLSRGAYPKPYRHTDPNEDAAYLERRDAGALLVVADGHNGVPASECAIALVREHADALFSARGDGFVRETRDLIGRLIERLTPLQPSRTCLVYAVVRDSECEFAWFGDSMVFRGDVGEILSPPNDFFLGAGLQLDGVPEEIWSGRFDRNADERVAVMSDGITNFVPRLDRLHEKLHQAPDDAEAARDIAQTALTGGAGDNVAVATIRLLADDASDV